MPRLRIFRACAAAQDTKHFVQRNVAQRHSFLRVANDNDVAGHAGTVPDGSLKPRPATVEHGHVVVGGVHG